MSNERMNVTRDEILKLVPDSIDEISYEFDAAVQRLTGESLESVLTGSGKIVGAKFYSALAVLNGYIIRGQSATILQFLKEGKPDVIVWYSA